MRETAMVYPGYEGPIYRAFAAGLISSEQADRAAEIAQAAMIEIGFPSDSVKEPDGSISCLTFGIPIEVVERSGAIALLSVGVTDVPSPTQTGTSDGAA